MGGVLREYGVPDPLIGAVLYHRLAMPPGRLPGQVFRARPAGRRPRKTQDMLERLCLLAGLGTPRGPPGRAGGSGRRQGLLGFSAQAAAPATRPPEKRQIMDGQQMLFSDWPKGICKLRVCSDISRKLNSAFIPCDRTHHLSAGMCTWGE